MPRVSVLLPVRDAAATLPEALDSLSRQTLEDHEVVAIEDASTDESAAILAAAARRDPRIHVEPCRGRGLVDALNQALHRARGSLVARMDADDKADPRRLELQAQRLASESGLHVLGCRVRWFGATSAPGMQAYIAWQNRLLSHEDIVADLFVEAPLAHPSVMMRRADLEDLQGYRNFDGPEDYDLWLRAHAAGLRFGKCEETLLDWRDASGRLSRSDPRYFPERFRALKVEALGRSMLAGGRVVVVWGAGPLGKAFARALQEAGQELVAFAEVDPRKLGRRIQGAPVMTASDAVLRFPAALHLGAVGQAGARARLRALARSLGLAENANFVAVA